MPLVDSGQHPHSTFARQGQRSRSSARRGGGAARPAQADRPPLLIHEVIPEVGSRHRRHHVGSTEGRERVVCNGVANHLTQRQGVIRSHRLNLACVCGRQRQDELDPLTHTRRVARPCPIRARWSGQQRSTAAPCAISTDPFHPRYPGGTVAQQRDQSDSQADSAGSIPVTRSTREALVRTQVPARAFDVPRSSITRRAIGVPLGLGVLACRLRGGVRLLADVAPVVLCGQPGCAAALREASQGARQDLPRQQSFTPATDVERLDDSRCPLEQGFTVGKAGQRPTKSSQVAKVR